MLWGAKVKNKNAERGNNTQLSQAEHGEAKAMRNHWCWARGSELKVVTTEKGPRGRES